MKKVTKKRKICEKLGQLVLPKMVQHSPFDHLEFFSGSLHTMKKSFLNKNPKSFHLYLNMKSCYRMLDPKRHLVKRRVTSRLATPLGDPRGVPKCFRKCFSKRYHSVHSKKRLQDLFGLNKFEYSVIILIIALNHNSSILKVNIDFAKMDEFNIDWLFPMDPLELFGDYSSEVLAENGLMFDEPDHYINNANVSELISNDIPHELAQVTLEVPQADPEVAELQPPPVEAFIAPDVNIAVDPNNILNMQQNLQPSFTITPPTSPVHQVQYFAHPAANDQVVAIAPVMAPPAPVVAAPAPVVVPVVDQFVQQQDQPTFIITLAEDLNALTSTSFSSPAAPLSPEEARRDLQRRNNYASKKYRDNVKIKNKLLEEELEVVMEENKKLVAKEKFMENMCRMMREAYVEMLKNERGVKRSADEESSSSKRLKF